MPVLTPVNNVGGTGAKTLTGVTLDGSDTFTYNSGTVLYLVNDSGGAVSPILDGDGVGDVPVSGIGEVDLSAGYAVGSIADGAFVRIELDTIREWLGGNGNGVTINSGNGLLAYLANG